MLGVILDFDRNSLPIRLQNSLKFGTSKKFIFCSKMEPKRTSKNHQNLKKSAKMLSRILLLDVFLHVLGELTSALTLDR